MFVAKFAMTQSGNPDCLWLLLQELPCTESMTRNMQLHKQKTALTSYMKMVTGPNPTLTAEAEIYG